MRLLALAAGSLLLAGCVGVVEVAAEPPGPFLVMDVTNASDRDVEVTYEFNADTFGGSGAMPVPSCTQEATDVGSISGDYEVAIDGEVVHEGTVPDGMGSDRFIVVRVRIDPDGEVEALPAAVLMEGTLVTRALPSCGARAG